MAGSQKAPLKKQLTTTLHPPHFLPDPETFFELEKAGMVEAMLSVSADRNSAWFDALPNDPATVRITGMFYDDAWRMGHTDAIRRMVLGLKP